MQDREQKLFIVGFFFSPVKISRPALFIKVFWRILSSEELNPLITVVSRHILCQKKKCTCEFVNKKLLSVTF